MTLAVLLYTRLLPPATKLGQGYVFTGVCDSVHSGRSASVHAGIPPRSRHPPGADTPMGADLAPPEQTPHGIRHPPRSRHPPTPLREQTPPRRGCWEIRSTRGRYASYWNAILSYLETPSNSPIACSSEPSRNSRQYLPILWEVF